MRLLLGQARTNTGIAGLCVSCLFEPRQSEVDDDRAFVGAVLLAEGLADIHRIYRALTEDSQK